MDLVIPQELKDSQVMKEAVNLAKQIICTKHCAKIILLYSYEEMKSQEDLIRKIKIEDVLYEFESEPVEMNEFKEREAKIITIDNGLKDIILKRNLKRGENGFNKIVFFVAIVIVHDFKHSQFLENGKSPEDGEEFVTRLFGGVLQLSYTSLDLFITTSEKEGFRYSSPQTESMIKDLSMKTMVESKQSVNVTTTELFPAKKRTEHFEPLIPLPQLEKITLSGPKLIKMKLNNKLTTNNKGKVDIEAELTNLSDVNVSMPQNYVAHYFHVEIIDFNGSGLRTRRYKAKPLDLIEPQVQLAPNQSHTFPLFSLNSICSKLEKRYSNYDWKLQTQFKGDILCLETKQAYVLESNLCIDDLKFTSSNDNDTNSYSVPLPNNCPTAFFIKQFEKPEMKNQTLNSN